MVVTRQDHHQRLLHEKPECQPRHPFLASKNSGIDSSLRKALRKQRGVLTRYHHVDVGQLIMQHPQGFGHPRHFVASKKAHDEAGLCRMSDPASSLACRLYLRKHCAGVVEKHASRWCQFDAASAAREKSGTDLLLKVPDLAAK